MKVFQSPIPSMQSLPSFVTKMSRNAAIATVIIVATAAFAIISAIAMHVRGRRKSSAPSTTPISTKGAKEGDKAETPQKGTTIGAGPSATPTKLPSADGLEQVDLAQPLRAHPSRIPVPANYIEMEIKVEEVVGIHAIHFDPQWTVAKGIPEIQKQIFQKFGRHAAGQVINRETISFNSITSENGHKKIELYIMQSGFNSDEGKFTVRLCAETEAV